MSEEQEDRASDSQGATGIVRLINSLYEIQLPSIIKKNLLTAVGKLITGSADAGIAHLKAHIDTVRARGKANALIIDENAKAVAAKFGEDPGLVRRGIDFYTNRLFKEQTNREKVAMSAVDEIHSDFDLIDNDKPIDQDWLDAFARIAEIKSDSDVQILLAKILAGEIRSPGSFSPSTIQLLSVLDKATARDFHDITSYLRGYKLGTTPIKEIMILNDGPFEHPPLGDYRRAQDIGLLRFSSKDDPISDTFFKEFRMGSTRLKFFKRGDERPEYFETKEKMVALTTAGEELLQVMDLQPADQIYLERLESFLTNLYREKVKYEIL